LTISSHSTDADFDIVTAMTAASQLNQARRAAGLSQRELSRRTGVPQSAIARIERGLQMPRADTLEKLLKACGFELRLGPVRGGGVDLSLIDHWLELSPAERAEGAADYGRALERLRSARPLAS
jgi:transcriptional regulator with XRE-family HTH domain